MNVSLVTFFCIKAKESNSDEKVNFEDIIRIVMYMAPSWIRKSSLQFFQFEPYHYARIYTITGEIIIITSLLSLDVEKLLKNITGVKIEKKNGKFASISFEIDK